MLQEYIPGMTKVQTIFFEKRRLDFYAKLEFFFYQAQNNIFFLQQLK